MEKIFIVCVDDQPDTLSAVSKDLELFETHCGVEMCESAKEAFALLDELDAAGDFPAVIISDHVMPGQTGVEFLAEVEKDKRFDAVRKILLTGLATHQDTVAAINHARIDHYLEKPWKPETLVQAVKEQLTYFVLRKGLDYQDYAPILDPTLLLETIHQRGGV
ncbi:MAG TPA: hypothetical protein DCE42_19080 [Myxococcales bacterium]|nr:hypothetical protein [Deltaproteobacteria bacterium]MBK03131.1 hypothetical protein [Deltaproteobacteria bacterium]MBU47316.1 hypothetical protein [Deltaproteobacteria bacterium]HAA56878.1 hypothetical protein [Myxococcales bacterium]|tara:strand:+ start:2502 stop:2990 length:489 start_codon:yes stop_codon:yes gene_type:complete